MIAYVGSTGYSTGPHLYYELKVGDQYVDPLKAQLNAGEKLTGSSMSSFRSEMDHVDKEVLEIEYDQLEARVEELYNKEIEKEDQAFEEEMKKQDEAYEKEMDEMDKEHEKEMNEIDKEYEEELEQSDEDETTTEDEATK